MTKYDEQLEQCLRYISSGNEDNPMVMLLKGGPYKIKSYYLENNDLDDIRGASASLEYVGNKVVPDIIKERFDESCIIYNGGGNIFCILPPDTEKNFAIELEKTAQKYLVSANVAYVLKKARFSDILNNYHETMGSVETMLNAPYGSIRLYDMSKLVLIIRELDEQDRRLQSIEHPEISA